MNVGLISFRVSCFDLFSQGTHMKSSQPQFKHFVSLEAQLSLFSIYYYFLFLLRCPKTFLPLKLSILLEYILVLVVLLWYLCIICSLMCDLSFFFQFQEVSLKLKVSKDKSTVSSPLLSLHFLHMLIKLLSHNHHHNYNMEWFHHCRKLHLLNFKQTSHILSALLITES